MRKSLYSIIGGLTAIVALVHAQSLGNTPALPTDIRTIRELQADTSSTIDFSEGTMTINGETIDPFKTRLFRSQFETYLKLQEDDLLGITEYQALLKEITDLLSPLHQMNDEFDLYPQVEKAYKRLYEAAEYNFDAGASKTLAHMIFNLWRLRDELRGDIQNLKTHQLSTEASGGDTNSLYALDEGQIMAKAELAQIQFQTQIGYFLVQRRYDHALMASYFYRFIFKGGNQEMRAASNYVQQLLGMFDQTGIAQNLGILQGNGSMNTPSGNFGDLNVNPGSYHQNLKPGERPAPRQSKSRSNNNSVKTPAVYTPEFIEQVCKTIQTKLEDSTKGVYASINNKEFYSALERMQEIFFLGEYTEHVATFPLAYRTKLYNLYVLTRRLDEYKSAKDYLNAIKVLDQIEELTSDFIQGVGERSKFISAMRMSKFKLVAAKQALSANDFEKGEKLMQESVMLWPLNPDMNEMADGIDMQSDAAGQYATRFDNWVEDENYNAIFENKEELGLALSQYPDRMKQLKTILAEQANAEFLINQAQKVVDQSPNLAWDLILEAEEANPNDPRVFSVKRDILIKALPYAQTIDKAQKAEENENWALSIAHYRKAQKMNPMSKMAKEGIARANAELLQR